MHEKHDTNMKPPFKPNRLFVYLSDRLFVVKPQTPQQPYKSAVGADLSRTSPIYRPSHGINRSREVIPTAERACAPAVSPYTDRITSEKPLITAGCLLKSGAELIMPNTLSHAVTRSRSPSSRFRLPSMPNATNRADS